MKKVLGKKTWVFADGDLPPKGEKSGSNNDPEAHEALMVVNMNDEPANLLIDILFSDREPVIGIDYKLGGQRVESIRFDKPLGSQKFKVPMGQYAIVLHSDVPVVAVFGRLDTRKNVSYYTVQGFSE
ncbi:MAG: sensory rhodopsin transducer [Saccharofermentanales bacterium]